jgi:mRNA-degrading endonuclease RelE of RelBE toxin-antitoxin system
MGHEVRFRDEALQQLEALDKPIREQIYKKIGHLD